MLLTLLLLALCCLPAVLALYHVYAYPHATTRAQRTAARRAARWYPRYRQVPHGSTYNYWLQYSGTPVANLVGRTPTRTWVGYHA